LIIKSGTILITGLTDDKFKTRRFLIDSPSSIFDKFYYYYLTTINVLIDERLTSGARHHRIGRIKIDIKRFLVDVHNLLLGLPSVSFVWDEVSKIRKAFLLIRLD